ncbi:Cbwd1 [Symbiodinium microadriaticum]|nr:Cbwd1 [Symbiodinium microadriaticum]
MISLHLLLVTGFLGAGKTTLVNYILTEQHDWKICVVENEFGEVSIDDSLVGENMKAKEDIIMMDNGCVCCSVRGDLVRTFGMLCSKRKSFDAIIIETTGLADPAPILFTFSSNALLQDNYRIDSIVCLVDSKHIAQHLDEVKPDGDINEAENQIAFSDRIILNKLDLVSKVELDDLTDRIRSMNSFASLIYTERSRAPLDQVLGLNSFSLERVVEVDPTIMEDDEPEVKRKKKRHNLSLVSSVGYTVTGLLDVGKFNQFMSTLLQTNAANLYRTKGVLAFDGQGDTKFVFQGVHEQINFGPTEHPWRPEEARVSKLVFIGKNLDPESLKESIQSCTSDPATAIVTMHKRA